MSTGESMLSGAIAGCAVVMATHPIWTVNVRYPFYLWEEDTINKVGHLILVMIFFF